jgi:putative SOS response-associated peptidase YedK
MCGRYSLSPAEFSEIQLAFEIDSGLEVAPRYNIAPTWAPGHEPPIVRVDSSGRRQLELARWWMIPSYWKRPLQALPTAFNARVEELASKRFWSRSIASRRCLVPATGWREFTGPSGQRQPHHFHFDHRLFAFAGLWDEWTAPTGEGVRSFSIVTVPANDSVAPIHDRMPLCLDPSVYALWLDPNVPAEPALEAARASVLAPLARYATDPAGNDVRREGPSVIAPARERQLDLFGS